ncbi:hypothetical protein BABINDRAFT_153634 [Babjeviella inositovora NRRL Y-12698]|uniref:Uncharacterized protein n=1 Tax=Babjeviella inositovora NRRL Y-12698 TaxID=984486 RepID=A0A1E3QMA0_9ASCO|nr:uncharacterized protein BABINDRAFT_153634 [Babjeviella inositovora NRRL Y-12698]ODQ78829.1 hypothetical protein BABINDRAFT_153634 [Babjeviella inositovora NRRL Y-12698]
MVFPHNYCLRKLIGYNSGHGSNCETLLRPVEKIHTDTIYYNVFKYVPSENSHGHIYVTKELPIIARCIAHTRRLHWVIAIAEILRI